jgi:hypothetical protein
VSSPNHLRASGVAGLVLLALAAGCDQGPHTAVILYNGYSSSAPAPLVVYAAYWENIAFPTPVDPGASSPPQVAEPTSGDTAYVVLAPGWDPELSATPSSLVVMQSRNPIAVDFNDTLTITVDDADFIGNCASGSPLPQDEADFITQRVFPGDFASMRYDAATCTLTPTVDGGGS